MTDIFVGEYGKSVYIDLGYNVSSATGIEIHMSAPAGGTSFVNSASVSVLAQNVTSSACGVFSTNKAVQYVLNSGDVDIAGSWKVWIQADFGASVRLISTSFRFKADNPG